MAASASNAPSCGVCGKDAESFCSACHQAGTLLAFCSEHQKLVRLAYALEVCGPGKSNPLRLPDFTSEEVNHLAQVAHLAVRDLADSIQDPVTVEPEDEDTIATLLEEHFDLPEGAFEATLLPMLRGDHIVELRTTSVWDYVAVIMKSLKLSAHDVTPQLESAWAHQAVVVCHRAARCAVNAPAYSGDTANFQQTYGRLLNLLVNQHFGAPLGSTRAIALHFDDTTRKIVKIGATTPPPPSSSPSS
ncbi:hypothetical protein DMC30DRAFT_445749 [Rhodotorula diobovata]|uniref:Uncharacterized protein n=1 Tax=Rhodotorula diobovata TaxID=5288 RepID=A0A5C5G0T1_9BASI|nr:hypothetical protein DMC30DRAFT_445749 [Rhodotorula diobovata]